MRPRLGQGAFRILVTDNYRRRCAVTGERTLPALEAAHIKPFADGGEHEASNGVLLRRDIHSLFDTGYVTITPTLNFEVSRRIKEEFENGRQYYELHGCAITPPEDPRSVPDRAALAWHNENSFLRIKKVHIGDDIVGRATNDNSSPSGELLAKSILASFGSALERFERFGALAGLSQLTSALVLQRWLQIFLLFSDKIWSLGARCLCSYFVSGRDYMIYQ